MSRRFLPFLLCAVLVVPMPPAWGQTADLQSALSGSKFPLTLRIKDLDSGWRRITLGGPDALSAVAPQGLAQGLLDSISQANFYYTKGEALTLGTETFLIAYHPAPRPDRDAVPPDAARPVFPPPDTELTLSLINVRQIAELGDVRVLEDMRRQAEADSQSLRNLKQIGLGMMQYVQDYDENLPPMKSAAATKMALFPYIKNNDVFRQPLTHEPYLPNTSLSGRSLESFGGLATMVVYYEASPMPDGTRAVVFLDGHAKRIRESDWPALKAASHVPNVPPR